MQVSALNICAQAASLVAPRARADPVSAEEAGDGRRTINSKDYQRVWRCLPLGLLSTMEEAAGGVAELKALSKAKGLGAIAAASRAWLAKTREGDETGDTPHTPTSEEEDAELATCLADDSLSDAELLVAIGRELGRVPAMADAALRAALAAVDAPTTGRSFELKAELARRLGQRRAELKGGYAHGNDSDEDATIEKVVHSCTACDAERAERAFAGGGFPEEAGFCPRCATAAIGLFGGYLTTDSSMFAGMLQAAVADKPGFIAARDKHEAEQATAAAAGRPPDAGEMRRVKAIVEQIALDASHAKSPCTSVRCTRERQSSFSASRYTAAPPITKQRATSARSFISESAAGRESAPTTPAGRSSDAGVRDSTTFTRPGSGRNFAGMDSQVLRPMTTAFCLRAGDVWAQRARCNDVVRTPRHCREVPHRAHSAPEASPESIVTRLK